MMQAADPPPIPRRRLGSSPLELTELGFGAAGIGNLYAPIDDATARQVVDTAWDAGVRYFDTAPYYGFGLSEQRLGEALRSHAPASCSAFVVSSKVGRLLRPVAPAGLAEQRHGFVNALPFEPYFDYSYDGVMRAHEASLQRLGLSAIDILLVHDLGSLVHGTAQPEQTGAFRAGGYRALQRLREEGQVRAIGLGVNEWQVCEDYLAWADFDCFLLAGRYTLLEQEALRSFMPRCAERGIGLILGGVYNSGILASGTGTGTGAGGGASPRYDYAPAGREVLARVAGLEAVCASHGVALAAAALQFVLAHPQVTCVIPGATRAAEFAGTLAHYRAAIPAALWRDLKSEGLLAAEAPVPTGSVGPDTPRATTAGATP